MLERPNICYILGKLGVQGCQICQSHSTRPQFKKKALYVIISGEFPENWVHKSYWHKINFDVRVIFHFSQ